MRSYLDTIGTYMDHGFWTISSKRAGMLCKPYGLPRHGYERLVEVDGRKYWIARTLHTSRLVWSIREKR